MKDTLFQTTDFDLHIADVLLVHRNQFIEKFSWTSYQTGRTIDGIVFCLSGQAEFIYPSKSLILKPGQLFFLSADTSYTVRCFGTDPFQHYTANFLIDRTQKAKISPMLHALLSGNLLYQTDTQNAPHYRAIFEQLLSIWQTKNAGYRLMAKSYIFDLLYHYLTSVGQCMYHSTNYSKLIPAQEALDAAYMENQSIAELAEMCDLSETHFRRLFSELFGCTPTEYRRRKRILCAKDYLLSGEYSISEVARMTGFSDQNYFTRIFHRETGITPNAFVKQYTYTNS